MTAEPILTEHRPYEYPIVYGYLRLSARTMKRKAALRDVIAEYAQLHELSLCGMFVEHGGQEQVKPAAFTGLLDVLAMRGTYAVVVPSPWHVGRGEIARERKRLIARTGVRLIVVREPSERGTPTRPAP
jgi:hypothetical protein